VKNNVHTCQCICRHSFLKKNYINTYGLVLLKKNYNGKYYLTFINYITIVLFIFSVRYILFKVKYICCGYHCPIYNNIIKVNLNPINTFRFNFIIQNRYWKNKIYLVTFEIILTMALIFFSTKIFSIWGIHISENIKLQFSKVRNNV